MKDGTAKKGGMLGLALGALGVVYGDIGTSPLYAINEIFHHAGKNISTSFVLGMISTVFWSLTLIVAFKYVSLVLRADYDGEGGVFALFGHLNKMNKKGVGVITIALILAAGLLFGDGLITPAISVLSAVEGLKVAAPSLGQYVIPITIAILTALFAIQSKGTHVVGKLFGPIILVWFVAIGLLGVRQIVSHPEIIGALNPVHIIFFMTHTKISELMLILGSVMLVVTGGEALFADMGHFGKKPIRISWFSVVYPMLVLSYLGQGAFLLSGQKIISDNIFFSMVPSPILLPMILLATMATIIASQALISGVFSLTNQGISRGYMPKLKIVNTNHEHEGQIYVPAINWLLYIGCVALVVAFGSSSKLAAAYGLAVAIDMVLTSVCMVYIAKFKWKWSIIASFGLFGILALIESMFLAANSLKFFQGGFVPISIALVGFMIMTTWKWGRQQVLQAYNNSEGLTIKEIIEMKHDTTNSFPRSLMVLSAKGIDSEDDKAPYQLQLFIDRYHYLPKHLIILTIDRVNKSYVKQSSRYEVKEFDSDFSDGTSFFAVKAKFGFMETPDLQEVVQWIADNQEITPDDDMSEWIFSVAKERLIISDSSFAHHKIRYALFKFLTRNSEPTYSAFGLGEDARISMELVPVKVEN
jgi:KUP system potassium uptake protein